MTAKLLFTTVLLFATKKGNCFGDVQFPGIVQNDVSNALDVWNFHADVTGDHVKITFHGDNMQAVSKQGFMIVNASSVAKNSDEIYLVEPNNGTIDILNHSLCVQFHNETSTHGTVVFVSTALANTTGDKFQCINGIHKLPWPLIANLPKHNLYHKCSISGAFNVHGLSSYQYLSEKPICNDKQIIALLESECTYGEGLMMNFADRTCIPSYTGWTTEQTLSCLDEWTDGDFTFTLLGDEYYNPQFIMRIGNDSQDEIIIFQDMIASTENVTMLNNTYIKMTVNQKEGDVMSCEDEEYMQDCKEEYCHQELYKSTCRQTCKSCDDPIEDQKCEFVSSIVPTEGQWKLEMPYVATLEGLSGMKFSNDSFEFDKYSNFTCHQKQNDRTYLTHLSTEKGCLRRYSCAKFSRASPSVLQYKLSQYSTDAGNVQDLCKENNFDDDKAPMLSTIHSRDYNILTAMDEELLSQTVDCGFSGNYTFNGSADHIICVGTLGDIDESCDNMKTVTANASCGGDSPKEETIKCLATLDFGSTSSRALITQIYSETQGRNLGHCWLFKPTAEGAPLEFYLMTSPQCDPYTIEDIMNGDAEFHWDVVATRDDQCDAAPTTTIKTTETTESNVTQEIVTGSSTAPPLVTKEITHQEKMTSSVSMVTKEDGAPGNPGPSVGQVIGILFGVIVGAVLIGAVAYFGWKQYKIRRQPYRVL